MCKRVILGGFALMLVILSFSSVSAQTPYIAAFFDPNLEQKNCPGMNAPDFLHVFLFNANQFVVGVDFAISYPTSILFQLDTGHTGNIFFGDTNTGLSMTWDIPRNGFFPVKIVDVFFLWNCIACELPDDPVVVVPNPFTTDLAYVSWPDFALHPVVGQTALACATIANEETTWGKVKALYED
jgi:hypothetical protein